MNPSCSCGEINSSSIIPQCPARLPPSLLRQPTRALQCHHLGIGFTLQGQWERPGRGRSTQLLKTGRTTLKKPTGGGKGEGICSKASSWAEPGWDPVRAGSLGAHSSKPIPMAFRALPSCLNWEGYFRSRTHQGLAKCFFLQSPFYS